MSQGIKTFYVCTEEKWDIGQTFEWREPTLVTYIEAARRIAKYLDEQERVPQERRQFWILQTDHDKPVLVNTLMEIQATYDSWIIHPPHGIQK